MAICEELESNQTPSNQPMNQQEFIEQRTRLEEARSQFCAEINQQIADLEKRFISVAPFKVGDRVIFEGTEQFVIHASVSGNDRIYYVSSKQNPTEEDWLNREVTVSIAEWELQKIK
jgi:transcriptional regulator of heat shock response